MHRDYAPHDELDTYSAAGIDDEEDFEAMTAAQRQAAEAAMKRRDRQERRGGRGARAARRSRAPDLLQSDESEEDLDGGLLTGMKRRARRQYDERIEIDDAVGLEAVSKSTALGLITRNFMMVCRRCH